MIQKINKAIIVMMTMTMIFSMSNIAQAQGEDLFQANCAACHFSDGTQLVGPGLMGVTEKRSEEWLLSWTKNSQEFIASGDADAQALFDEFGGMLMTPFDFLSDEEILSIYTFIDESNGAVGEVVAETEVEEGAEEVVVEELGEEVEEAAETDISGSIYYWSILTLILLVLWLLYNTIRNIKKTVDANGGWHEGYHNYRKNYFKVFLFAITIAILLIFILKDGLDGGSAALNTFMFGALPYVVLLIFLIGSIFRFFNIGFKVSSLSSQFLEGRKLFFGSQPFHWGIMILFFGHLIAFLIPRAVIAWNGHPVRLLILEGASLIFALSALVGLTLLIKRRFTNKRVSVVTNNMDVVVYVILLTQIISGIGIALFARWGSTWFATSITPYLRSIFTFEPNTDITGAMPWYVQLHIISAFLFIAIIPFSRFMHFLVVPLHYIRRKYQVVYWNWNRKKIRNSTNHTFGRPPKNH